MAVDACQLAGLALPWLSALPCPVRPALTLACDLLQDSAGRPLGLARFCLLCHTCRLAALDVTGKGPVSLGEVGVSLGPGAVIGFTALELGGNPAEQTVLCPCSALPHKPKTPVVHPHLGLPPSPCSSSAARAKATSPEQETSMPSLD